MNADIRVLLADGERALRGGDGAAARTAFVEAGLSAAGSQLWRTAVRCYRRALELDLTDRELVGHALRVPPRALPVGDWTDYARALDRRAWRAFGCRGAQIVIGDAGAHAECPGVGAVLELMMTADDLVELRPTPATAGMPLAMALIIARRALWIAPRDHAAEPAALRIAFDGRAQVRLDELGDWEPVAAGRAHFGP
jgi:hypothetical protein